MSGREREDARMLGKKERLAYAFRLYKSGRNW